MSHAETAALGRGSKWVRSRPVCIRYAAGLRQTLWELWSEEHMTAEKSSEFIDVQVQDVCAVPLGPSCRGEAGSTAG